MKILHIEDNIDWYLKSVEPSLKKICSEVKHSCTFEDAIDLLKNEHFDYIISDQSIPYKSGTKDDDIMYGIQLVEYIRKYHPSLPVLILTGQSYEEATEKFVEDQPLTVFWDGLDKGLTKSRPKRKLLEVIEMITSAEKDLSDLDNLTLDLRNGLELDNLQKRVIKLFAKHQKAIGAEVSAISGGYSSSKVLKVTLIDESGNPYLYSLAKIDSHFNVDQDKNNYLNHITKLPVGCFPTLLGTYFAGCGDFKGVFYQFAFNHSSDYFELLKLNQDNALIVLERAFRLLRIWGNSPTVKKCAIGDIRKIICTDSKIEKIKDFFNENNLFEFEEKTINTKWCVQHSDLHGKNILVSDDLNPIFIDFGDVSFSLAVLDIVTLELSPYFHADISSNYTQDLSFFENWFNDQLHISISPFPKISEYLREIKRERSFMSLDYAAVIYSYALRQLTYEDTNHEVAKKLLLSAINKLNSN